MPGWEDILSDFPEMSLDDLYWEAMAVFIWYESGMIVLNPKYKEA